MPVDEPMAAIVALLLLHKPPATASLNVIVDPTCTVVLPAIAATAFTVNVIVANPAPTAYVIVHVPPATPVTTPVDDPTVATAVLLLLQCPPAVESVSVLVDPSQTLPVPVML